MVAAVRRCPRRGLTVHAARILRSAGILVDGGPAVVLGQQLLDLPVPLFGADTEFQVLLRDGVPILVDHHDGQQIADGGEEEPVQVMLDGVADGAAEDVEDHLADDEEQDPEPNVA